ncbi:DUF6511 domain-containing protein [Bosea sp. LjRoot237]|uniref:DUF6511 domain-containing protein n=1 Tax=Bosea sp. LjRoot237 TaxID=3342292 RepID=UPI003ECFF999
MAARPHINDPADCFVCRRHAVGVGAGSPGGNPRWVCNDCIPHLAEIRTVRNFDPYELRARADAGEKAGELLDGWGKSNMAELTEEEWFKFLSTIIGEFGESLRRQVAEMRAPW